MKSSQNEAVRLALMLKDRPAPPMPYFESSNSIYDQQLEGILTHLRAHSLTHTFNVHRTGGTYPSFEQGFSVDDDKYIDDQWKELLEEETGSKSNKMRNDDNFLLNDDKIASSSKNADDINKVEEVVITASLT